MVLVLQKMRKGLFPCRPAEVGRINMQIVEVETNVSRVSSYEAEGSLINAFFKILEGKNFLSTMRYEVGGL